MTLDEVRQFLYRRAARPFRVVLAPGAGRRQLLVSDVDVWLLPCHEGELLVRSRDVVILCLRWLVIAPHNNRWRDQRLLGEVLPVDQIVRLELTEPEWRGKVRRPRKDAKG